MPKDRFVDVTIGEERYRIGLVRADIGNWCVSKMAAGQAGDLESFKRIQACLLDVISIFRSSNPEAPPLRIYDSSRTDRDGVLSPWLIPGLEIEYNIDQLNQLVMKAQEFNFDPFFERLTKQIAEEEKKKARALTP